jgi:serine/threonine protein kinase
MELLGPNLEQLMKLSGGKMSLKTVLILGLQMIDRIEVLHNAGYVYKDIKPENWVMGLENKSPILHLIDFGKCKRYRNKETGKHLPFK